MQALPGNGLTAKLDGQELLRRQCVHSSARRRSVPDGHAGSRPRPWRRQGKTPLFFARGKTLLGIIAVADVIKEDSPQAVRELQNMGIRVVMLTGDNERTAKAIGAQAGVDEVIAGVLPDGKESVIRSLKESGQGGHGGRRHQRCPGPDPGGHRHRHRRGHRRCHRRGGRGADEEPLSATCPRPSA